MCYLKRMFLTFLISINCLAFCQNKENSFYAEIVIIEDLNLINTIDSLLLNNNCVIKRADLYLDYRKSDYYLILGQGSIKQYARFFKEDSVKIFMTFLNNNPFFILSKESDNLPIRKTDFKVDLSEFLNVYDYSIRDLSYWILKEQDKKMEVIKEVLIGCN